MATFLHPKLISLSCMYAHVMSHVFVAIKCARILLNLLVNLKKPSLKLSPSSEKNTHSPKIQICTLYENCATLDDSTCGDCVSGSVDCPHFPCFTEGLRWVFPNSANQPMHFPPLPPIAVAMAPAWAMPLI